MKLSGLFLISFLFFNISFAQDCGECSKPIIALYDFEMTVAKPDSGLAIGKWMQLFYSGWRARYLIRVNEPNNGCINWMDGAMINATLIQGGTLKFGATYTNLPASGSYNSADYLLWGKVEAVNNIYRATLIFETGPSREIVKTITAEFTNEDNTAFDAGDELASEFGSILQVIRDFEIYKRDTDNRVAIKDLEFNGDKDVVTVKAEKTTVNAGEKVNIEITLTDCDGVALVNRTVHLKQFTFEGNVINGPENGSFSVDEVVTDGAGKATAVFTPSAPGVAIARVGFPHYKPCGRWDVFFGEAALNVPPETMKLDAVWKYKMSTVGDTNWTQSYETGSISFNSNTRQFENAEFRIKGLIERNYSIPVVKVYDKILSINCTGTYTYSEDFHKDFTIASPGITYPEITIENIKNYGLPVNPDVQITINTLTNDYPEVDISGDIKRNGEEHYKYYNSDDGWQTNSTPIDDTSIGFYMIFDNSSMDNKTVVVNKDTYTYTYVDSYKENNTATINDYHGHSLYTEIKEEWYVTISQYGSTTDVEKLFYNIPESFSLEQNFPNPFNPKTSITYSIVENSPVSVKVYDMLGSEVCALVNEPHTVGTYKINFDASSLSSGIYIYRISAGKFSDSRKMVLLK